MSAPAPSLDRRTVGGVALEAVRESRPVPHWRVRVVATGYTYAAGCFKSDSRPHLWADVEHVARLRGRDWFHECMDASDAPRPHGPFVLWGFHPAHCDGEPLKLAAYSSAAYIRYNREGWTCASYAEGRKPKGLRMQAEAARMERAGKGGNAA